MTLAEADELRAARPRRVRAPLARRDRRALRGDGRLPRRGRRGLRLRQQPARRGAGSAASSARSPTRASCPPTSGRCSARARARSAGSRSRATRPTSPRPTAPCSRSSPTTSASRAGSSMAGERIAFQGLPARICWLGYGERHRLGLRFNEMVRSGELKAPIVIGRDHLDSGSVASPYRETEGMADESDAIADWPLLNALVNTAAGASWVSIHHGGGVGIGRSIHAGMVCVADGTDLAAREARARAHRRPGHGRHPPRRRRLRARASRWPSERGVRIPMRRADERPRDRDRRPSGPARARPRGDAGRAALARGAAAHRRHDRDDARAPAAPGSRPTRSASRCGSPSSRSSRQPALPVQAADPADRDGQPGASSRSATRRSRSTRAACRCPTCAARSSATSTCACATSTATAIEHDEVEARPDRRDVPARGRPPRRRAVPRPRARPGTFTTWEQFERHHRDAFVRGARVRGARRLVSRLLVRAGLARRRRAPRPGVLIEVDGDRIAAVAPRRAAGRRRARSPGSRSPASPTRTRTRSSARCAAARRPARARSGPGASRCTRWPAGSTPTPTCALARATFAEMALAGITVRRRVPLPPPRPRRRALRRPERDGRARVIAGGGARPASGSRCSTPATCTAGIGEARRFQRRFSTATRTPGRERVGRARATGRPLRIGAAIHSVRAVDPESARAVAAWAARGRARCTRTSPSSQPRTRRASPRTARRRPALLADAGALSRALHGRPRHPPDRRRTSRCSAAPATLLPVPDDRARPRRRHRPGAAAARRRRDARRSAATRRRSSTSSRRRARSSSTSGSPPASAASTRAAELLRAATAGGYASLGWPEGGRIEAGALADLVTVALDGVRLAGTPPSTRRGGRVRRARGRRPRRHGRRRAGSCATARHVTLDVAARAGGSDRGDDGEHARRRQHRPAGHERPGARRRAARLVRDAALVIEDGRVAAIERAGAAARRAHRRGRALRDPGLRRQPHPPRLRRRPRRRVRRADGRRAVRGGRHPRHHGGHPRGRATTSSRALAAARRDEALPRRHHAPRDQVRLRPRRRDRARARAQVAGRADRRRHVPRRPRRPGRVRGPRRRLRRARLRRDARRLRAARPLDRRLLRARARSTPTSRAPCSRPAAPPGSACACTATSSAPARASQLAVELGAASVDHCTYLDDADIEALAGGDTVATFLPATDFSTRQPYPDARRVIDAGATVAIATNCNPGSSYTTSMAFCIALAVRDMRMTAEEALPAATLGGARALRRDDVGRLAPGRARRRRRPRRAVLHAPRLPARRAAGRGDRSSRGSAVWIDPDADLALAAQ